MKGYGFNSTLDSHVSGGAVGATPEKPSSEHGITPSGATPSGYEEPTNQPVSGGAKFCSNCGAGGSGKFCGACGNQM